MSGLTKIEIIERLRLFNLGLKYCPRCRKIKLLTEFGKHKNTKYGLSSWCKLCQEKNNYSKNNRCACGKLISRNSKLCRLCQYQKGRIILTKKFLIKEYIINKKSCYIIARETGWSNSPILLKLKKFKIRTRTYSECMKIQYKKGKVSPLVKLHKKNKHWYNWKGGFPKCIDCGKQLTNYNSKRCYKCSHKILIGENATNWAGENAIKRRKYFCKICKKEITYRSGYYGSKLCLSCGSSLKLNKILTKTLLLKYYIKKNLSMIKIAKKFKCSLDSVRDRLHKFNIKIKSMYIDGRTLKIYYCKCGNTIHKATALYGKKMCMKCRNKFNTGKNNYNYGKIMKHTKNIKYGHTSLCMGYELAYAKWLRKNHIAWRYEPKAFPLKYEIGEGKIKETTYTPDFYLPKTDEFIEIKGWWRDDAEEKFAHFQQQYPNIKITVLMKPELQKMGVLK